MNWSHNNPAILFDANCIIYHCFNATEKIKITHSKSEEIGFKYPFFTDHINEIINYLCAKNCLIKTIRMVWEEIQKKRLAEIVNEYVYSKECPIDSRYIRPYEKYKIERKFKKKLEDFYNKSWFSVEQFQADQDKIDAVILFYHSLSGTPKMTKHLAAKGRRDPEPSLADMNLLIYSKENRLPILSNDNDFNLFKDEIGNNNICYKIFPLKEISDSSILID